MSNNANISIPIYIWIGIGFLFSLFITILSYFLKKFFEESKKNDDAAFGKIRHITYFLIEKLGYNPPED